MPTKPISTAALICGAIRDPLELLLTIEKLMVWIERGTITRIVLSTWSEDVVRCGPLIDEIRRHGVQVVDTARPVPPRDFNLDGNHMIQHMCYLQGLCAIDDCTHVFKLRTDYCVSNIEGFGRYIHERTSAHDTASSRQGALFNEPIVVDRVGTLWQFYFTDWYFFAEYNDAFRIANFNQYRPVFDEFIAESQWLSAPFLSGYAFFKKLYFHFRPFSLAQFLQAALLAKDEDMPDAAFSIMQFYWMVLEKDIQILNSGWSPEFTLDHLLTGLDWRVQTIHKGLTCFCSDDVLKRVANANFATPSGSSLRLAKARDRILEVGIGRFQLSTKDVQELQEYADCMSFGKGLNVSHRRPALRTEARDSYRLGPQAMAQVFAQSMDFPTGTDFTSIVHSRVEQIDVSERVNYKACLLTLAEDLSATSASDQQLHFLFLGYASRDPQALARLQAMGYQLPSFGDIRNYYIARYKFYREGYAAMKGYRSPA